MCVCVCVCKCIWRQAVDESFSLSCVYTLLLTQACSLILELSTNVAPSDRSSTDPPVSTHPCTEMTAAYVHFWRFLWVMKNWLGCCTVSTFLMCIPSHHCCALLLSTLWEHWVFCNFWLDHSLMFHLQMMLALNWHKHCY